MSKYLIEVQHDAKKLECARAVAVFLQSGSHFIANAEWGCMDGEHKAWIIIDADNKEEARCIIPPAFRAHVKIVTLNRFTLEEIEGIRQQHVV
jgi:hypothetical protein